MRNTVWHVARFARESSLTLRNWAIGCYIVEYEQNGADRAKYGARLLESLSDALTTRGVEDMAARSLRLYRQFFLTYENIWQALPAKSASALLPASIWQTLSAKLRPRRPGRIREGASPRSGVAVGKLFTRLSFSHFAELIAIDDPLKRDFYEVECIGGNWSVRALKRQVATLYFERSGLSADKEKLAALAHAAAEQAEPKLAIRDPYVFEFLGLRPKEAVSESDLVEYALAAIDSRLFVS
ncbi:MAG: cytoplasmic protein, partial [Betaproteobacteria bacterium]|nr:cytoplasmic protein [Betaproteobacteria bacterium]